MDQVTGRGIADRFARSASDGVWLAADAPAAAFGYSDGDAIEDRLLALMRDAVDLSVGSEELEAAILDFPSRYHLTASRANLLRPVAGSLQGRVLELGAGCGAITRFLGETASEVVAVEGSRRRAAITAARCRDLAHVAVIAARLQDVGDIGPFDAVTLIGVLEYARSYADPGDADPVATLLALARSFLRPGGTLLLAIENQLGLKYFALYPEDHLGQPMAGIENRYGPRTAVTFGRAELAGLLRATGLADQRWFFPLPDYKFPVLVLTEAGAAGDGGDGFAWAIAQTVLGDPQRPLGTSFALQRTWPGVWRNGIVPDLANSFLVLASDQPVAADGQVLGIYYGSVRRRSFMKQTRFLHEADGKWVRRAPLYANAPAPPPALGFTLADEPLWSGRVLEADLVALTGHEGWRIEDWAEKLRPWLEAFRERFDVLGPLDPSALVPARAIDALPRNLVMLADGSSRFIDQEWQPAGEVPFGYICFRACLTSLQSIEQCALPVAGQGLFVLPLIHAVFAAFGWDLADAALQDYIARESAFQAAVSLGPPMTEAWLRSMSLLPRPDFATLRQRLQAAQAALAELAASQSERLEALAQIQASTTWRMTAPIRHAVARLPRLRAALRRFLSSGRGT